jgi:AraC-like DNA-binding protein
LEIEVNPEEVHRLYFEEGLTLKEVSERLGYKSQTPIRRIFKEQGWETKKKWKELDYDRVYELYFERKLSLEKVAKEMGLSNHYPIVCIFEDQGWETRSPHGRRVEINPGEVYRMYYENKMTMKEISEYFGYKSSSTITAIFREQGWNSRRMETVDMDIDPNQVRELYFKQKLSLEEVGSRISKTRYALLKLFEKMEWRLRGVKCESIEEREARKKEAQRRHQEKVNELRNELFGTECEICGDERELIHRKDGKRHSPYLIQSLKGLRSITPSDWAPVCKSCHLDVHALMRVKTFEWKAIKRFLREAS